MKTQYSAVALFLSAVAYVLLLIFCPGSIFTVFMGLPVTAWICTGIHELAHLAAFKLLGLNWTRLGFSVFTLCNQDGRLVFQTDPTRKLFRGECACAYSEDTPLWKYWIALLSGGVFCGLLGIGFFLMTPLFPYPGIPVGLGIVFSLNALINLLPISGDLQMLRAIISKRRNNTL